MNLLRPELLWLAAAGVPIVVLHFIRRRKKKHLVPSLLLWEQVVGRTPRRVALRFLTGLLSLLLLLAAVGGASMSAAAPVTGEPAPPPKPLLIAIGASARMTGERWDRAVEIAANELARKAAFDPVTILAISERPRLLVSRETDPMVAVGALADARPGLTTAAWPLARDALRDGLAQGRVVAIGVDPDVPEGVVVQPVGGETSGITAFNAEVVSDNVAVFLRTWGAVDGARIVVTLGDEEIARRPAVEEETFDVPRGEGGTLVVRLEPASGPAFDDEVTAVVPSPRRLALGLVTEKGPDPFLAAALRVVAPLLDEEKSGTLPPERLARAASKLDVIVIADSVPPAKLPRGNYLLLTPPPESLGFVPIGAVTSAPIWERAADHPVTRQVDAAEVQVMGAIAARPPEGATTLLRVPDGAVAAAGEADGVRYVWLGLGPGDSTLPVTAAYPLLVRNALAWFASLRESPFPTTAVMGEPLSPAVRLAPGVAAVKATGAGVAEVLAVVDGTFAWRPDARVEGIVTLAVGEDEHAVALNAILPLETAAAAREGEPTPAPDRSGLKDTRQELWTLFAAAAAAALLLEWLLGRLLPV
ncbi:MAG: BatA domain-containing protein [Planctomycetota bacterium]